MAKNTDSHSERKNLQKEITYQLDSSLGKLKDFLGEKKFNSRIRKAVKLLTEGIDKKMMKKEAKTPQKKSVPEAKEGTAVPAVTPQVKKKAAVKKAAAKKGAVKKAPKPVAVKPKASAPATTKVQAD